MTKKSRNIWRIITAVFCIAVIGACIYVMSKGLGLNPDLDFGAGAYYYADIPEYEKTLDWDVFTPALPYAVYVLLFLAWGVLMYLLWKWIDRK